MAGQEQQPPQAAPTRSFWIGLVELLFAVTLLTFQYFLRGPEEISTAASARQVMTELAEEEPGNPSGLVATLVPSTFRIETRKSFRLTAKRDFDSNCGRVSVDVPELGYSQTFTRKELFDGATSELNPSRAGTFNMTFSCEEREVGSVPLTVVIGLRSASAAAEPAAGNLHQHVLAPSRWLLSAGKAIYQEKSFFQLPISVRAEKMTSGEWLPYPVTRGAHFLLRDTSGELRQPPELTIDQNTAISNPVWIDFPVSADYSLIAYKKDSGQSTNELKVSWRTRGPKLQLVSFPGELTIYDVPISHGSSELYLADAGYRLRPSEALDILVASPVGVSNTSQKLQLTAEEPVATYQLSASGAAGRTATVAFHEPMTNAGATLRVGILSPKRFLIVASIVGLAGILIARRAAIFKQKWWAIVFELLSAVGAGFLLYSAELHRWLPLVGSSDFLLGYLAASSIGLLGGFVGVGVFKALAAVFGLKLSNP